MKKKEQNFFDEKRKTRDLTSLASTLMPFAKSVLGKKGFVEIDVLSNWDKIVGSELAEYSFANKIDFKRDEKTNGVLHIIVPGGAFALEIEHRQKMIIEKVNTYFGYNAISSIRIMQNAASFLNREEKNYNKEVQKRLVTAQEETYINQASEHIDNEKLREAVKKLGLSIFSSPNNKEEE